MPSSVRAFVTVVVAAYLVYAGALIWWSSFSVGGERWFALFDDGMISMRYGRHLAEGQGLVWNPGERVEGFTNPGWTLVMAMVHMVESRKNWTSFYVQILSALSLAGTVVFTALLAMQVAPRYLAVAGAAAAGVAFYFPLNYFSLMGMETGILACLVTAAMYLLLRAGDRQKSSMAAWALLAGAIFVRLDAVVPALALAIAVPFVYPAAWKRNVVFAAVAIVGALVVQTLLRLWYYGDPLPNTYYLKMAEVSLPVRIGRGVWVTSRFLFNHFWPLFLLAPFAAVYALRHSREAGDTLKRLVRSLAALPLAVLLGQVAYSTYVGGDVWEWFLWANRFLVIAAPALFILLALLVVKLLSRWPAFALLVQRWPASTGVVLSLLLILLTNVHGGYEFARDQALFRRPLYGTGDAAAFVRYAHHVRATYPTSTTIAIDRAGTLPYFLHNYRFYDSLGKADPVIAKMPSRIVADPASMNGNTFVPGHTKWDAAHTIGCLKPDIVIFTADFMNVDYEPWLREGYHLIDSYGIPGRIYRRSQ